jgi:catechol 2,3-dioxygenase-like lactoylglutathione lyase family enzyme
VAGSDGGPAAALDHVQVAMPAGGEEAARRFYGGVLGLAEIAKPAPMQATGGVWFEPGLHLGVEAAFQPARKAHPGLRMADLDAAAARLQAAGADVEWDTRWPEVRRFYTHDPFGNRLELLEAPQGRARRRR